MANSPETHANVETAEVQLASFDSRAEVYLSCFETELGDIVDDPAIKMGIRFADLRVLERDHLNVIVPRIDRGAHPKLLTGSIVLPGIMGYRDVRRALVTHEDEDHIVTTRDWFVDLTEGTCCVMETHSSLDEKPTVERGPVIETDPAYEHVVLTEGSQYVKDFQALLPAMMESDTATVSDFMADTHLFIGGLVTPINAKDLSAYQRVII